jgi:hypothetical protein
MLGAKCLGNAEGHHSSDALAPMPATGELSSYH